MEIVPKPEDQQEAITVIKDLMDKINSNTQGVLDGSNLLDREYLKDRVDPNVFYVVEK